MFQGEKNLNQRIMTAIFFVRAKHITENEDGSGQSGVGVRSENALGENRAEVNSKTTHVIEPNWTEPVVVADPELIF